jgi:hypothetical protein
MIGAWLGASLGIQGVPADWRDVLVALDEIAGGVDWLVRVADSKA